MRAKRVRLVGLAMVAGLVAALLSPGQANAQTTNAFHLLTETCPALLSGPLESGDVATTDMSECSIPANATAVQATVVARFPLNFGNLRISPSGVAPLGGVVNFANNGIDNSNTVTVPLGTNGELDVSANSSAAGILVFAAEVQVLGWFGPNNGTGLEYVPTTACAFFDTRLDATTPTGDFVGRLEHGDEIVADIITSIPASQGVGAVDCGVPANARAALVNFVTIEASGDVSVNSRTFANIVNNAGIFPPINNSATHPIAISNTRVTVDVASFFSATTHVRGVVLGYYQDVMANGLSHTSVTPCAAFDTRTGTGSFAGKREGGQTTTFDVVGAFNGAQGGGNTNCGVPTDAVAVEVNLVAIAAEKFGNLRGSPAGVAPTGGILNFGKLSPAMNNSNSVVIPVSAGGAIDINVNTNPANNGIDVVHVRGVITGFYSD